MAKEIKFDTPADIGYRFTKGVKTILKDNLPEPVVQLLRDGVDRLARSQLLEEYPGTYQMELDGLPTLEFLVNSRREHKNIAFGQYEIGPMQRFAELANGKVVWDVGAAYGLYCLLGAQMGAKQVMAFEPEPEISQCLRRNASNLCNGAEQVVETFQLAVSNESGVLILNTSGAEGFAPSVSYQNKHFSSQVPVSSRSVVQLVCEDGLPVPELMKIDVEGHEGEVLEGLGGIRPEYLFIEIHPGYGANSYEIGKMLSRMGYRFEWGEMRGGEFLVQMKHDSVDCVS